jgi:hypothetical protein
MEDFRPSFTFGDLVGYLLAYMCWIATAAVSLATMLFARNALNVIWPILHGNRWLLRAIDRFGLVFLGLVWLVYVIFVEQYYRTSITDVRNRRYRYHIEPTRKHMPAPDNKLLAFLNRLGLDVLGRRFVISFGVPLIILGISYGLPILALNTLG